MGAKCGNWNQAVTYSSIHHKWGQHYPDEQTLELKERNPHSKANPPFTTSGVIYIYTSYNIHRHPYIYINQPVFKPRAAANVMRQTCVALLPRSERPEPSRRPGPGRALSRPRPRFGVGAVQGDKRNDFGPYPEAPDVLRAFQQPGFETPSLWVVFVRGIQENLL